MVRTESTCTQVMQPCRSCYYPLLPLLYDLDYLARLVKTCSWSRQPYRLKGSNLIVREDGRRILEALLAPSQRGQLTNTFSIFQCKYLRSAVLAELTQQGIPNFLPCPHGYVTRG